MSIAAKVLSGDKFTLDDLTTSELCHLDSYIAEKRSVCDDLDELWELADQHDKIYEELRSRYGDTQGKIRS